MKKTVSTIFLITFLLSVVGCKGAAEGNTPNDRPDTAPADETYYSDGHVPSNLSILIVSEEEIVFEAEKFRLVIPPRHPFHPDIFNLTSELIEDMEEVTGLSFFPAGKTDEKIDIASDGSGLAYGGAFGINADIWSYSFEDTEFTFVHELAHCIQVRNADIPNKTFMEEYAIITSLRVAQFQEKDVLVRHLRQNYAISSSKTLPLYLEGFDIEGFYLSFEDHGWNHYLIGYAFGMYLEEVYGQGIHDRIVIGFSSAENRSNQAFVDFIKETTSANVFETFGGWYQENRTQIY